MPATLKKAIYEYCGTWYAPTKFINIGDLVKKLECRLTEIITKDRSCYLVFNQVEFPKYHQIMLEESGRKGTARLQKDHGRY